MALGGFGLLAVVLAATGIHGLVAYAVARRRREIGIRIAIGASTGSVLRLVLARVTALVATGSAVGLVLALAAGQLLATIVYHASPRDPLVFGAVGAVLGLIGLTSCWGPTRRALRIEPTEAIRAE